jgi:hypothetical protein
VPVDADLHENITKLYFFRPSGKFLYLFLSVHLKPQCQRVDVMSSEPLDAYRVEDWAARNGISRSQAYKEINSGRLIARKVGSRTIITGEDGMAWRRALPQMRAAQSVTRSAQQNAARISPGGACISTPTGQPR